MILIFPGNPDIEIKTIDKEVDEMKKVGVYILNGVGFFVMHGYFLGNPSSFGC